MKSILPILFVLTFMGACQNAKTTDVESKKADVTQFLSEKVTEVNAQLKRDPNNAQLKAVRDYLTKRQSEL